MTPSGRVHWFAVRRTSSGSRNAFQLPTMARTATVASAGRDSGSSDPPEEAERAAAVDARPRPPARSGMARKNGRRMMIVMGSAKAACGRATPHHELQQAELSDQDEQRQDRDGGREEQPQHEQRVDAPRGPGNRMRAKAKAASADRATAVKVGDGRDGDAVEELRSRTSSDGARSM